MTRFVKALLYVFSKDGRSKRYQTMGEIFETHGEKEETLRYYIKAVAIQPKNLECALHVGRCLLRDLAFEEALNWIDRVLESDRNNPDANLFKGIILFNRKDGQTALRHFLKAMASFGEDENGRKIKTVALQYIKDIKYQRYPK